MGPAIQRGLRELITYMYINLHGHTAIRSPQTPRLLQAKAKPHQVLNAMKSWAQGKSNPLRLRQLLQTKKKTLRQQHLAARILSITGSSVTGRVRGAAVSTRRDSPKEVSIMRDATRGLRLITCRDRNIAVSTERESRRGVSTLREATRGRKITNSREMSRLRLREDATSDESGATGAGLHYQLQGCEMMSHLPIC